MADQNLDIQPGADQAPPPNGTQAATENANGVDTAGENDGGEVDVAAVLAENERLKRAHGTLLNEKQRRAKADKSSKELSDRLRAWNEIAEEFELEGPDQVREVFAERSETENKQARDKGDIDKVLQKADQRRLRDLAKKDQEIDRLRNVELARRDKLIERLTIDQQLKAELEKHTDPDPGLRKGAYAIHRPNVKLVEDDEAPDGYRVAYEIAGDEIPLGDAIKRWIEEDTESWPYHPKNKSAGGGAPPGSAKPGAGAGLKRSKMTVKEKTDFISAHGSDRYNSLPA